MRNLKTAGFVVAATVALGLGTAGTANAAVTDHTAIATPTHAVRMGGHDVRSTHPASATSAGISAAVALSATCNYTVDWSKSFYANGQYFYNFAYAGHYSGLTVNPSKTVQTSAGFEAQCLLVVAGYNPGTIDGVFGPNSQAAARAFQHDVNVYWGAGLAEDGMIGAHSWPWLRWWAALMIVN